MHAQHFLIFGPLFHQFLKSATNLTPSRHFSGGGDKTADRSFYGYIGPEIIIYSGTPISTFFHCFFCSFHWIKDSGKSSSSSNMKGFLVTCVIALQLRHRQNDTTRLEN
jgi:hypothetical protein